MKDNVFINLSDAQLSYKVFEKNKDYSKLLKFTYYGVYYCTIQFDYLGSEFMTDLLGVTIK